MKAREDDRIAARLSGFGLQVQNVWRARGFATDYQVPPKLTEMVLLLVKQFTPREETPRWIQDTPAVELKSVLGTLDDELLEQAAVTPRRQLDLVGAWVWFLYYFALPQVLSNKDAWPARLTLVEKGSDVAAQVELAQRMLQSITSLAMYTWKHRVAYLSSYRTLIMMIEQIHDDAKFYAFATSENQSSVRRELTRTLAEIVTSRRRETLTYMNIAEWRTGTEEQSLEDMMYRRAFDDLQWDRKRQEVRKLTFLSQLPDVVIELLRHESVRILFHPDLVQVIREVQNVPLIRPVSEIVLASLARLEMGRNAVSQRFSEQMARLLADAWNNTRHEHLKSTSQLPRLLRVMIAFYRARGQRSVAKTIESALSEPHAFAFTGRIFGFGTEFGDMQSYNDEFTQYVEMLHDRHWIA